MKKFLGLMILVLALTGAGFAQETMDKMSKEMKPTEC